MPDLLTAIISSYLKQFKGQLGVASVRRQIASWTLQRAFSQFGASISAQSILDGLKAGGVGIRRQVFLGLASGFRQEAEYSEGLANIAERNPVALRRHQSKAYSAPGNYSYTYHYEGRDPLTRKPVEGWGVVTSDERMTPEEIEAAYFAHYKGVAGYEIDDPQVQLVRAYHKTGAPW